MTSTRSPCPDWRDLTPEWAQQLLDTLPSPKFAESRIPVYARRMLAGDWQPSTIKVSRSGKLLDGRHRCAAVILSGVTIKVLVCTSPHQYGAV